MKNPRGLVGSVIAASMPLLLVLGGAGIASLGLWLGSPVLMALGAVVAVAGVVWGIIVLDLTNPFDWF